MFVWIIILVLIAVALCALVGYNIYLDKKDKKQSNDKEEAPKEELVAEEAPAEEPVVEEEPEEERVVEEDPEEDQVLEAEPEDAL
ncbi:MAG: hypothetical protein K2O05_01470, partial [Anaeroplasmataceae bacterium]|nr:hypothetical protein [Anaeroplasmataceae bacterium]